MPFTSRFNTQTHTRILTQTHRHTDALTYVELGFEFYKTKSILTKYDVLLYFLFSSIVF